MKAAELMQRYESGRLDFRGENLRGQSFKGKDLSGADFSGADIRSADFSGADIRSANFTNAKLQEANFTNAKAGLQRWWVIVLLIGAFLLSGISGIFSGFAGAFVFLIFDSNNLETQVLGWVSLIFLVLFQVFLIQKGFGAVALVRTVTVVLTVTLALGGAFTVSLTLGGTGAVGGALATALGGVFGGALALAITVAGVGATAIAVAVAGVVAGVVAVFLAVSLALFGALFGAVSLAATLALSLDVAVAVSLGVSVSGIGALAVTLVSTYIAWRSLKGDEKEAWVRSGAVALAAIWGTSFQGADLTDANFTQAQLKSTDLRRAILIRTNWHRVKKLDRTRPAGTILIDPAVRDLVVTHRGQGKSYVGCKLQGANLMGADLSDANLKEADISQAILEGAWLERANLTKTQALGTDFHQATLTGACLESWNIDSTTQLDGAICEYVYLLKNQQERRPNSGTFGPGEFTKLFDEVLNTIDLIFRDGLEWKAFVTAFDKVRVENGDTELDIQSIENKGDGVMVIKLQASLDADKGKIHQSMMTEYDIALKAIEEKYRAHLQAKDGQISQYQQENMNLWEMTKLMANRPINVEAKAVVNNMTNNTEINAQTIGIANTGSGNVFDFTQNITNPESKQKLAEAAVEIQALLKQLEQTAPAKSMSEKMAIASSAIAQIESHPTLKQRAIEALAAGGIKAFEAAIDHPIAAFVVGAVEEWKNSACP